ncbi:LTA synthase family protein [Streptococcus devriesei]|uniref:LTA synthase family protein n=1 Tax=Streptococcus devriesei TaxID=231233 RepID=UPI000404AFC2|nr:alkaline phosphatase family protein [Streptococcus devriesei]
MKNDLKNINWSKIINFIILIILTFFINFYTVNQSIWEGIKDLNKIFQGHESVATTFFILSVLGISFYLIGHLSWKFILKLFSGYFLYLLISYFLIITRNLNNRNFEVWNIVENNFWQSNFLPVIIFMTIIAFLGKLIVEKLLPKFRKSSTISFEFYNNKFLLSIIFSSVLLNDKLSITTLHKLFLTKYDDLYSQSTLIFFLTIFYSLLLYQISKGLEDFKKKEATYSLCILTSSLFAIIFNYTLQMGVAKQGELMEMYVFPAATTFQIIVIFVLCLFVYSLLNNYIIATVVNMTFWIIVSIVNFLKQDMRNEPMLPSDFAWIKQIDLIMQFINVQIVFYALFMLLLIVVIGYFCFKKELFHNRIIKKKRFWLLTNLIIGFFIFSTLNVFASEKNKQIPTDIPIITQLNNNYNVFWMGTTTHASYRSLMFVWVKQLTTPVMEMPKGYSREKIDHIYKKYESLSKDINKGRVNNIQDQTVIYVLSESLSNPKRIDGVQLSKNILPNIDSLKSTNTSGLMKSDGYGGGTANMEFQTLTSLPMYNLSPSISALFTDVFPKMPYVPSISNLYKPNNRLVIHLGDAQTYSRKNVYKKLGFNKFIASKNGDENVKNFVRKGLFPSDESTYSTVLNNIGNGNKFISVITYQNHVPWSYSDPSDVYGKGKNFSDDQNNQLSNYARLLNNTDNSTLNFLNELKKLKQKITVVFYGDHLPSFYPQSAFKNNPNIQYETDYFIWSNYPTKKLTYPLVNSSDFSAELLKQTSSKVSPYYALLTEVLDKSSVDKEKLTKEQQKTAKDLQMVEYDLISGRKYLKDKSSFFRIPR